MILYEGLGGEVSPEVKEQLDTNIIETYRKFFAPGKTSLYENIDKKVQDVTGKRQMEWGAHIGIKGYDWMKNVFSEASR